MNRRAALKSTGLAVAAALAGARLPLRAADAADAANAAKNSAATGAAPESLGAADENFLTLVADTLLPATPGAPGAGAAEIGLGAFVVLMARDCHAPEVRAALARGLRELDARSREKFARPFAALPAADRETILAAYETHCAATTRPPALNPFRTLKELILHGYFTSEVGATQALRYLPIPGAYIGSVRLNPTDRSWAL
ncbi:MAG: hypothetical protein RLZZ15_2914 [Verrucomicrobiota bacterium]